LAINLNTFAVGNVAIADLRSAHKGDSFVGQLRYANGAATLAAVSLPEKVATPPTGSISQSRSGPQFQGKVKSRKAVRLDCTTVV